MTVHFDFTDKTVFITGAGSGIGRATAHAFAAAGADVVDSQSVSDAGKFAVDALGPIDIGVNNAGIEQPPKPLAETSDEEWDRLMAVDLRGVFVSMKQEIRAMGEHGGSIVNISSGRASSASRAGPPTPRPSTASSA